MTSENTFEELAEPSAEHLPTDAPHTTGHTWSYVGVWLFTFIVYTRPYEWSPYLSWLSTSAFWVAISTVALFIPTQLSVEGRLTALHKEVKLVLALVGTGLLSIPIALSPSVAWAQFVDYLKVVVIFIVMVNVVRNKGRFKALLFLILSVTVVLSVSAVKDYVTGNLSLKGVRIEGAIDSLFSNPNDLALHLVTMLPIALALAFGARGLLTRCLSFLAALSIIAGVIATFSRAGFLGLILTLCVLTWRLARRNRGLILAPILGLMLLTPLVAGYSGRFTTNELSAISRMDDLKRSVSVALHHPLIGVGMNNYRFYSNQYQVSHNSYTQVWAEMGSAALPIYVALLIAPLKALRKAAGQRPGNRRRDENAFLATGLEVSIYGYMVCSFFASVAYLWYAYYLIAFSICVRRLSSAMPGESTSSDQDAAADGYAFDHRDGSSRDADSDWDANVRSDEKGGF